MAITVETDKRSGNGVKRNTGVTTGNEFIYRINKQKALQITAIATATGNATFYYSNDEDMATPTDFSTMIPSSLGELTDFIGEETGEGIMWAGVKVASGTWTVNIKEL